MEVSDHIKSILKALPEKAGVYQFFEENGEVCPANWSKGSEGMKANHEGVADYLAKH